MDFDAVLDEAEAEPTPSRTVRVCVKPSVAKKRAALLKDLDEARAADERASAGDGRLGAPTVKVTAATDAAAKALEQFDDETQDALVTLKFARVEGQTWALLTSAYPMRLDVALDRNYGYNYDAVTEAATRKTGRRLDDDGEHELTEDQWTRLFKVLSGHDIQVIRDAVWTLNEWEPAQNVEALTKSFGAA